MHQLLDFLVRHGYYVLFGVVLAEQAGLPIPSIPVFLAMGALIGLGNYSFGTSAGAALIAALISDSAWNLVGRKKGSSVLKLLCRISLEPDSCVSTTRYWFRRLGGWAVVIAKFLPGLSTIAAPMAGLSRMPWWKFLALDSAGIVVWAGSYMSIGMVFRTQLEEVAALVARLGSGVAMVTGVAARAVDRVEVLEATTVYQEPDRGAHHSGGAAGADRRSGADRLTSGGGS